MEYSGTPFQQSKETSRSKAILSTMVHSKKLCAFFIVLVLGLLVPGPSITGVEALHLGGGGGGGMRGVEALLAAGILAKLLGHHHHHEQHHHHHGHHHG
ncbi:hypothetical protein TNIN_316861 [Trichonephila inaurata madagascariensis]|uniref:Uncharacterized protein n=1 Tax=Trichonephila inaurata madagascariensis TaxID=2747483 RepID=A0A8X6Y6A2_9ARAC|nr:hypothetical protein TNIN_316861 [Trichonephila inaurata madagascariensis]